MLQEIPKDLNRIDADIESVISNHQESMDIDKISRKKDDLNNEANKEIKINDFN